MACLIWHSLPVCRARAALLPEPKEWDHCVVQTDPMPEPVVPRQVRYYSELK